jgi:basic membrane protein A
MLSLKPSRIGVVALLISFAMIAAACGDDAAETSVADTEDAAEPEAAADDFSDLRVVMILDQVANDGGWNSSHVRAGGDIEAAFPGVQLEYVEEVEPGQTATNAFEDAAASGADVVIGTTYYQDDMMDVAAANPDVVFLTWAGFTTAENVGHFDGASEDGRYLDGLIAGSLTESGIIGYPVGFPFNEVNRAVNAFTIGVREVNADAEVQVVYLNTWFDPSLEQQAAEALVNAGADVLAHEVSSQVYATVMAQNGGHVIGYTNDWSDFEPEAWASSFLYSWGGYYISEIQAVIDGSWEPAITFGGLADGFIDFAPYGPDVSDEILELVEQRKVEIVDGSFDIFAGPILDNEGNEVIPADGTIPFGERTECCQWLVEGVVGSIPG